MRIGERIINRLAGNPYSLEFTVQRVLNRAVFVARWIVAGDLSRRGVFRSMRQAEQIEGVIYASILTRHITPPEALGNIRAVLLNCYSDDPKLASVTPAERRGGCVATATLIRVGYRRIAFITGEAWMDASHQRQEGYIRILREAGPAVDNSLIVEGNFLPSGGRNAMLRLLSCAERHDAVFCANDLMALGAYEACKEYGLTIPKDMAIMGYDDQELAEQLHPKLSTVLLPHREMGQWCVDLLDRDLKPVQLRMECLLIERDSV